MYNYDRWHKTSDVSRPQGTTLRPGTANVKAKAKMKLLKVYRKCDIVPIPDNTNVYRTIIIIIIIIIIITL